MEPVQRKQKKTKDKKPLYILAGFLVLFGVFIYLITRPSTKSEAIDKLKTCFNKNAVKIVWDRYEADLQKDEGFLLETRKKLTSLDLTEEEIKECRGWIPPAPVSINLIIVPDLSRRIIDTLNNPNQIENDIFILQTIWKSFVGFSKFKKDTKDKLIIDVTDIDQAKGQFGKIANDLQFDLSNHKNSNRLFFTIEKDKQFETSIREMYELAQKKPLGADYKFYLRRYLVNHLKKPTLFDNYINKVVIITDGYLEAENKPADTKIHGFESQLHQAVSIGNILDVITLKGLNIPKVNIDLSNSEILICEVNERRTGKGFDFEILRAYWEDWFKRMNAKKIVFIQRELSTDVTAQKVNEFITK